MPSNVLVDHSQTIGLESPMKIQSKVTPWLSFESEAEEAAEFYVSVIPDSQISRVTSNPETGSVLVVEFDLAGLPVCALNMGRPCELTTAFSFSVSCESQAEIDELWSKLSDGGKEIQCGWLNDRYGLAWQIVPAGIMEFWNAGDSVKTKRMVDAMLQMVKLDIARLEAAFEGR